MHVAETSLILLLDHLNLVHVHLDVLLEPLFLDLGCLVLLLVGLRLVSDFHQLSGIVVIVLLKLLELSTLLEEGLRSSSTLVFQDLLLFKISTLCSLNELVSVVLVPHLEMVKSVAQSLNLFFALPQLAIKLIAVPLQFFLLLSGLDDIVCLRVVTWSVSIT